MSTPFTLNSRTTRIILFRFLLECVGKERENFGKFWLTLTSSEMIPNKSVGILMWSNSGKKRNCL